MPESLTIDTFERLQGQRFMVESPDEQMVVLELVEVKRTAPSPQPWDDDGTPPTRTPFSLVFRGPNLPSLGQKLYPMNTQELGEVGPLFLVPVYENATGRFYEAVFN